MNTQTHASKTAKKLGISFNVMLQIINEIKV